jgi:hypothetical protein
MDIKDITSLYGASKTWPPTVEHYWDKEVIIWRVILRGKEN